MATTHISNIQHAVADNENALVGKGKAGLLNIPQRANRTALGLIDNVSNNLARARIIDQKDTGNKTEQCVPIAKKPALKLKEPAVKESSGLTSETIESYIIVAPNLPENVKDIDAEDNDNPQLVSEYINEIYIYLRILEKQQAVKKNYMRGYQITPKMRTILIDWLVQVHNRFHLLQETLFLTIAIIDRFLQDGEISKSKLQLIGVTAMWIASKYEEMYAPEVADFVYITDNAYTKADIRKMERIMLKRLNFDLGRPLPLHFLRRYSKAAEVDSVAHTLAKYLLELSVLDYGLCHVHPSEVSAACLCLSMRILDEEADGVWNETLQFYSTYTEAQLEPVMDRLALLVFKSPIAKQQAVRQKYQSSKFMRISTIEELLSPIIQLMAAKAESREEAENVVARVPEETEPPSQNP